MSLIYDGELNIEQSFDGELNLKNNFDGELVPTMVVGSEDKHYVYEQARLSNVWVIHHNLNKYPSVSVVDTAKTSVTGEVEYLDLNTVQIRFNAPFSGYAYLN